MRLTPRVAGFRSEYPAGFKLECMAGFVGTRIDGYPQLRTWSYTAQIDLCANFGFRAPGQRTGLIDYLIDGREQLVGNDQPKCFGGFLV